MDNFHSKTSTKEKIRKMFLHKNQKTSKNVQFWYLRIMRKSEFRLKLLLSTCLCEISNLTTNTGNYVKNGALFLSKTWLVRCDQQKLIIITNIVKAQKKQCQRFNLQLSIYPLHRTKKKKNELNYMLILINDKKLN